MTAIKKPRTTKPVINPHELPHDELVERYEELSRGMGKMKELFATSRGQTQKSRAASIVDPMTGLYNRRAIPKLMDPEIAKAWRNKKPVSMIMLDGDHFKRINDTKGHDMGDQVIKTIGKVLNETGRTEDISFRFGGEEFLLFMPNTDGAGAKIVADRLVKAFRDEKWPHEEPFSASVGYATYPDFPEVYTTKKIPAEDLREYHKQVREGLIKRADIAAYVSKETGRNKSSEGPSEHSFNVAELSVGIAKELGIPEKVGEKKNPRFVVIETAAQYHDIGKIQIPDEIEKKRGPLTDAEKAIMRTHVDTGVRIAKEMGLAPQVQSIIGQHHEWYDGTGYPAEKSGDDIRLGARIIAVADAYDAMTSGNNERAYRGNPKTPTEAIQELDTNAGTQFSPEVVKAFKKYIKKE